MLRELNITMTIDTEEKMLYIGEENSSGAKYPYNNIDELMNQIRFYLENYYLKEIEEGETFFKIIDNIELMHNYLKMQISDTNWSYLEKLKELQNKELLTIHDKPIDLKMKLDGLIEKVWEGLEDIPFYEDEDGELYIEEDYLIFEKGTSRESIWRWFDERHSKGVAYLLNECQISGKIENYLYKESEEEQEFE